ncbi:MAG: PQQ-dependent sugar dehydrogenase [Dehalococcoidia bacterium]
MKLLLTALTLLVMLLAACSDGSSDDAGDAARTTATPPPATAVAPAPAANASAPGSSTTASRTAQSYDPSAFRLVLEPVLSDLRSPVFVTSPPDGSGRLFIVERGGTIRIAQDGRLLPQPFLDVSSIITAGGEQGLLGLAFHPRYQENGTFFVSYTARGDGTRNTVARYRASGDPNRADPGSGTVLLAIDDFASNHNGGMLAFGPDGYLYVGTGDGGGGGDPQRNGQNLGALLGKLLRLDVNGGEPYAVPTDNPFANRDGARPEIWAYGLRNPWRFSFDRATGDLWIADVGQSSPGYEEVNFQPAGSDGGENYGWNRMEGLHCYQPRSGCDENGITRPILEYEDRVTGECSITGGYVYRGQQFPALTGAYIFGDYCSGRIWSLHQAPDGTWVRTELLDTDLSISSFGEDESGELYVADLDGGRVYHLTAQSR